jgi:hypothetical protein
VPSVLTACDERLAGGRGAGGGREGGGVKLSAGDRPGDGHGADRDDVGELHGDEPHRSDDREHHCDVQRRIAERAFHRDVACGSVSTGLNPSSVVEGAANSIATITLNSAASGTVAQRTVTLNK